jgi:photosynthetic reaction center cytochrome c subunit
MKNLAKILILTVLITICLGYFIEPRHATAQQSEAKTAEQVYRNIQVLKGIPADQLLGTMSFIAGSLGVTCNYCHVNPFDKDEKPTKLRAREMILMMKKINQDNFKDNLSVNCATCHRGSTIPATTAPVAHVDFNKILAPASAAPAPLPTADEVFDKYIQALGGKDKIDKMTTLILKGSNTQINGPNPPQTTRGEIYRKAPNKLMMVMITPGGTFMQAYNGTIAWRGSNDRTQEIRGQDLLGAKRDAGFFRNIPLKDQYSTLKVVGRDQIGDKEVYVVEGVFNDTAPEKSLFGIQQEKLFFDTKTGLLIRRYLEYSTPLGKLPEMTDFEDYRSVEGVMLPFTIRSSRPPFSNIQKFTEITLNTPVEDTKFDMPKKSP